LLTFPVRSAQVVLAKFLSAFLFLSVMLLFTFFIPLMLTKIGDPDRGIIVAGYLGTLFLGAAYISIGLWVSSITKNQITAFILSLVVIFCFYIIGSSTLLDSLPAVAGYVGKNLSLSTHFDSVLRGVLSLKDLVYYLSVVAFFLFLNARAVAERNWK